MILLLHLQSRLSLIGVDTREGCGGLADKVGAVDDAPLDLEVGRRLLGELLLPLNPVEVSTAGARHRRAAVALDQCHTALGAKELNPVLAWCQRLAGLARLSPNFIR